MSLAERLAHFATHRKALSIGGVSLLGLAAVLIVALRVHFASDVLDLLPQQFESVRAFKTYDREFSQARELTFALIDESKEVDLDAFVEHFADALREEPWVLRILERSPMETTEGAQQVAIFAVPLLLNLPTEDFTGAMARLSPGAIEARFKKLRGELTAGSPKAEFELDSDPLGLIGPALKPLAGSFSLEQTRPLASPDGTMRIVLAVTRQSGLGAPACQATMRQVEEFRKRVLASFSGPKPQILVTGRTAYVGELSLVMRGDIIATMASSAALVAVVFWVGFRRLRPLGAILQVLLLCCLAAVAVGALVFRELNMITIGLCSILIGLGVDFGMLLCGIYQAERDAGQDHQQAVAAALARQGRGVLFGAMTSAAAFLCLVFSGTKGFAQLGVLIAFGILFAAAFMMTLFFVLLGTRHRTMRSDPFQALGHRFTRRVLGRPQALCLASGAILLLLTLGAAAPVGHLRFDADPKSMEPKDSQAGIAMRTILAKMPSLGEPLLVLGSAPDSEAFHRSWTRLQFAWSTLVTQGILKSASTPAGLAISPERVAANAASLSALGLAASRAALEGAITAEGLQRASFTRAFSLLESLEAARAGHPPELNWRRALPEDSPWRFVVERFFGNTPGVGAAYIVPPHRLSSLAEAEALHRALEVPGCPFQLSGWSYTLQHLVPWSQERMIALSLAMLGLNVVLLLVLFRHWFPLAILLCGLLLSVGAMLATLKLCGVALNLFNVLAFPLVLGVGVDYGIYVVIAFRTSNPQRELAHVFKPVLLSGLTTTAGFASLITAHNPALRGLGVVTACGVGWCLISTFLFVLPACAWRGSR